MDCNRFHLVPGRTYETCPLNIKKPTIFVFDLHAQICESRSKQVYEPFDRKMDMFFDTAHVVVQNNPVINKAYKVAAYQL